MKRRISILFFSILLCIPVWPLNSTAAESDAISRCQIPDHILDHIADGIAFALENKAAFEIKEYDLDHVHLLVDKKTIARLREEDNLSIADILLATDAMLFHTLERPWYRTMWPVETQKQRNIVVDLRTDEIRILDPSEYNKGAEEGYTILTNNEKLNLEETFQITFRECVKNAAAHCSGSKMLVNGKLIVIIAVQERGVLPFEPFGAEYLCPCTEKK